MTDRTTRSHERTTDGRRQFCAGCLAHVTTYDTVRYDLPTDFAGPGGSVRRFHFCTERSCQQKAAASILAHGDPMVTR